jgi:glucose-6-phosphate 1-dehydrogenase
MQLVSLVALEPPASFEPNRLRDEKSKVLRAILPFTAELASTSVVRGQYGPGIVSGQRVVGYREEPGVRADSRTETYVAAKFLIGNWRWAGVPFYVRTGKRLARSHTEIAVQFRRVPHTMFRGRTLQPNWLIIEIQPCERITVSFDVKRRGPGFDIRPALMQFSYERPPGFAGQDAYVTLLNDCLRGDATLFDRADNIEAAWTLVDPILRAWASGPPPDFPNYAAGSWGPKAADELLARDGRQWRVPSDSAC